MKGIIYLAGKMGAGKGDLAAQLVKLDPRYHIVSVAETLKQATGVYVGVPYTPQNKAAFRPILQAMADTQKALGVRERWVGEAFRQAEANGYEYIVIDDGRKQEELDYIRRLGVPYVTVRLECPEDVRAARVFKRDGTWPTVEQLRHPATECELDNYPFDIVLNSEVYRPVALAFLVVSKLHLPLSYIFPPLDFRVETCACGDVPACVGCTCEYGR